MIDEKFIKERAYALWERDDCPDGAANFYWYLTRQQLEAQAGLGAAPIEDVQSVQHKQELDIGLIRVTY